MMEGEPSQQYMSGQLLTLLCCIKTCDRASKSITVRWTNALFGTKDVKSQFRERFWDQIWSCGFFCFFLTIWFTLNERMFVTYVSQLLFLYIFWLILMVNSILCYCIRLEPCYTCLQVWYFIVMFVTSLILYDAYVVEMGIKKRVCYSTDWMHLSLTDVVVSSIKAIHCSKWKNIVRQTW